MSWVLETLRVAVNSNGLRAGQFKSVSAASHGQDGGKRRGLEATAVNWEARGSSQTAAAVPFQRQPPCGNVSSAFHSSSLSKGNGNLGVLVKHSDLLKPACLASRATM